jgi:hypothetical protein
MATPVLEIKDGPLCVFKYLDEKHFKYKSYETGESLGTNINVLDAK